MGADEIDTRLFNTFRLSTTADFGMLELEDVQYPTARLKSIYEALKRKTEEAEEEAEDADEAEESESDDFWEGEEEPVSEKTSTDEATSDDFWSGANDPVEDTKEVTPQQENDFWSGEGTAEEEVELEAAVAQSTGNQYLGQLEVTGRRVHIQYRDHGKIDGDRVRILLNGTPQGGSIRLAGYFQRTSIELTPGVNRIAFEALNQGTAGKNTAEFNIEDEDGAQLFSNQWSITTGWRSTILVIREE